MALIIRNKCKECGIEFDNIRSTNSISDCLCDDCKEKNLKYNIESFHANLDKLSIEDRIRRIEDILYKMFNKETIYG